MSKPKTTPLASEHMMQQAQTLFAFTPMAGPSAKHFWEAQEQILNETEAFARSWFERRHTATRTALDLVQKLADSGPSDPTSAFRAVAAWQAHSAERIAEDMREWVDLNTKCLQHLTQAEMEAGEESLDRIVKSAKPGRREKDDVPV